MATIVEFDRERALEDARKLVKAQARKAARRGAESNVVLHPIAEKVPTVAAYAKAIGLGADAAGWHWHDVQPCAVGEFGRPTGRASYVFSPSGEPGRVRWGVRPTDIVKVGLRQVRNLPLNEVDWAAAFDLDVIDALHEEVGGDGERMFWGLLTELTKRANRDGWLAKDPYAPSCLDDGPWDDGPGTDDDPEPIAVYG